MLRETAQQLLTLLARWDRRLRLQRTFVWLPRGISVGLIAAIAVALLARLRPLLLPDQLALVGAGLAGIGVLGVLGAVWLRQHNALEMAHRFDTLFGLRERVSTTLEMAAERISSPNPEITTRQLDDTLNRASKIDAAAYLPLRLDMRDTLITLGLVAALVLLIAVDNPQTAALTEQHIIQDTIQQQTTELESLREQIAEADTLDEEARDEMLDALDEAIDQLSREELSQEEAYASLSELADSLQQIAEQQPEGTGNLDPAQRQALEDAAQQINDQMGELSDQAAGDTAGQNALEQAAGGLEALSQQLGEMGEAAQQEMADALEAAADAAAGQNQQLADSLQEAADALREGDSEAAQQALEDASQQFNDQAQQDATGSQAQAQGQQGQQSANSRQVASQAARQAQNSARQVAQSGQQGQQGQSQQQATQSDQGNSATRIEQGQPGQEGAQAGQQGQQGGDQQGSSEAGQSTSGQQGEAQTGQTAAGAASGAGDGEGVQQEGSTTASGQDIGQDNDPTSGGLTDYDPVFAPETIGQQEGSSLQVSGSGDPGDTVTREGNFAEGPEGESIVGYDEVFSDYANAANEALERDYIPLSLRDVVHDYFSALAP